ncbi:hypothetical protein [Histophilus somni]|uniref:hypothetical protein n=1 Tax=Histophilus somni TaxID=731 RepID=UPI0015B7C7DD|nr:hypothetical protein [Histophilus somni]
MVLRFTRTAVASAVITNAGLAVLALAVRTAVLPRARLAAAMGVSVLNKISVHNSFSEC